MRPAGPSLARLGLSLGCACLLAASALVERGPSARADHPFSQELIDSAVAEPLLSFHSDQVRPGTAPSRVRASKAIYFMALASWYDPAAAASDGTLVRDRLVVQIRHLISEGNEPDANGGLEGWSHNAIAQAMVLARYNHPVWHQLSPAEHSRVELLMKALAIGGNWSYADPNDFRTALDQLGNFGKTFNPNYREGYVGVMIAASLFLGPTRLNDILVHFHYDLYMQWLADAGFVNIIGTWQRTGRALMEEGGDDCCGGHGAGVKVPWIYQEVPAGDELGIVGRLADFTYDRVVSSTGAGGLAYIADGTSSPYEGLDGMLHEFASNDSGGARSDALYSYEGWMNSVISRTTLLQLGGWTCGDLASHIEDLMSVGSEDLIYKLAHGYQSHSNGADQLVTETLPASSGPSAKGYYWDREVWQVVLGGGGCSG